MGSGLDAIAGQELDTAKSLPRTARGDDVGLVFHLGTFWLPTEQKGQEAGGAS